MKDGSTGTVDIEGNAVTVETTEEPKIEAVAEASKPVAVVPRSLQCSALRCKRAADRAGLCRAHRRGLALTASVNDAVFRFLRETDASTEGEVAERVIDAGEHFAKGLALLVSTQAGGELAWNSEPLNVAIGRWRVRFAWALVGEIGETHNDDETEIDETDIDDEGHDDD